MEHREEKMQCLEPSKEMQRAFGKIFKELRAIRKEIADLKREVQRQQKKQEANKKSGTSLHYQIQRERNSICGVVDPGKHIW